MSTLLHVCCAPCLIYPVSVFKEEGYDFSGYFYNPNIHPFREFKKRLDSLRLFASEQAITIVYDQDYGLRDFLRAVVFKESQRCRYCYRTRLEKTARMAIDKGYDSFSSTLLYSRYQNHGSIIQQAQELEQQLSIPFFYRDFRNGWQRGIDLSITQNLYRQSYCGCIYSEQERYDKKRKKELKKETKANV